MQVQFDKEDEQKFEPCTISFRIESIEDARALYAICNYVDTAQLLGGDNCYRLGEYLESKYGDSVYVGHGEIANGITCEKFYN